MMLHFVQWQRLLGNYPQSEQITDLTAKIKPRDPSQSRLQIKLDTNESEALLGYMQTFDTEIREYRERSHGEERKILQPYAVPRASWRGANGVLVSVMKPNNCIKYMSQGQTVYGVVRQIYEFSNPGGVWETALIVNPIINFYPKLLESSSTHFRYILFLLKSVVGQIDSEFIFVSPDRVECVAAYRLLPKGVFSIQEGGIILRPYDSNAQLEL